MLARAKAHLARLAADRGGNLVIEFALALPILSLLLFGLLDLGRYSLQKSALLQGAREGAHDLQRRRAPEEIRLRDDDEVLFLSAVRHYPELRKLRQLDSTDNGVCHHHHDLPLRCA